MLCSDDVIYAPNFTTADYTGGRYTTTNRSPMNTRSIHKYNYLTTTTSSVGMTTTTTSSLGMTTTPLSVGMTTTTSSEGMTTTPLSEGMIMTIYQITVTMILLL